MSLSGNGKSGCEGHRLTWTEREKERRPPHRRLADLYTLQRLVHEFVSGSLKEEPERQRLKALAAAEMEVARELDRQVRSSWFTPLRT